MKKTLIVAMLAALVVQVTPARSLAQTTSASALQSQIQALLAQIKSLNEQMLALQQQQQNTVADLLTMLRQGDEGENVRILQALLAADPELYPEGMITGYYGGLTAAAIRRFQKRHGLEQVGFIGPRTLAQLKQFFTQHPLGFDDNDSDDGDKNDSDRPSKLEEKAQKKLEKAEDKIEKAFDKFGRKIRKICAKIPPGHLIAPGWLKTHGGSPLVPICRGGFPPGNGTSTPPSADITPPTISNLASVPSMNSATIYWTTDESSDSQVAYGTSTTYGSLTTLNSTLVTSHSAQLAGLLPSTFYHYRVSSKDSAGNLATSTDQTFTTLVAPDTTAPFISSVVITPSSTTANISWTTNESSTSKIYASTVSPVDPNATSTLVVSDGAFVTAHSLNLSGLVASTTYNFIVESADAAVNKATSSGSFVTMP